MIILDSKENMVDSQVIMITKIYHLKMKKN